jgi:PhnB protein
MTADSRGPLISLMLAVPDACAAARWYAQALGATQLWNMGAVVGLRVGQAPFFLGEPAGNGWDTPATAGTRTARVELFADDPDGVIGQAVAAGADGSIDPVRDHQMPWGPHRQGGFIDPFGHLWLVGDRSPLSPHPGPAPSPARSDRDPAEADRDAARSDHSPMISHMLAVSDASAAAGWYARALGAAELWNLGSVVGLNAGGAPFFLGEPEGNGWDTPASAGTTTVRVELFADDPDILIAQAVATGAEGSAADTKDHERPWGVHRQGGFTDPFGHIWLVGDKSPLRPMRAATDGRS